jgi:orotidine-5'-phosphate decarboxylase
MPIVIQPASLDISYYTGCVQKSHRDLAKTRLTKKRPAKTASAKRTLTQQRPLNLSTKSIPSRERLILALDVPSAEQAREMVTRLGDAVVFYKLGLQLFMADGYFELVQWLHDRGKQIFVDLKFFDVPETVKKAVRQLKDRHAAFVTVHGNDEILKAAVSEKNGSKILAVTVLTSLDRADLKDLGFKCDVKSLVLSRARRALELNCDGVISSGLEAPLLRKHLGEHFLIVTPGIRPVDNDDPELKKVAAPQNTHAQKDDQKRTTDVEEAFRNGADYIVVGRPILNAPDPLAAANAIQERISRLFA